MLLAACTMEVERKEVIEVKAIATNITKLKVQVKKPALPDNECLPVSEQLKYIFTTDQEDRIDGTFIKEKDRDSLRLKHVQKLYSNNLIHSVEDMYHAAFIFTHAGGPFIDNDPNNFLIAHQLFKKVSQNSCDYNLVKDASVYAKTAFAKYLTAAINNKEEVVLEVKEDPIPLKSDTNTQEAKPGCNT